jgi:hypothetical protein
MIFWGPVREYFDAIKGAQQRRPEEGPGETNDLSPGRTIEEGHMRVSQIFSTGGGGGGGCGCHGGNDRYGGGYDHGRYGGGHHGRDYFDSDYRRGRRRRHEELLDVRLDHILDLSLL